MPGHYPLSKRGSLKEISGPEILKPGKGPGCDMVWAQIEAGKARILARPRPEARQKAAKIAGQAAE